MAVKLSELISVCDQWLQPWQFDDYCPNGLQVQGREQVSKIVTGVTASQELIERAVAERADAILVHHGYFWKGDDPRIQGMLRNRLARLLENNISLIAYHLPLDAQPEFGNNARLADILGIQVSSGMEPDKALSVGFVGELASSVSGEDFAVHIEDCLGRAPLHIPAGDAPIKRLAWCTGAAQASIEKAASLGVDAYLTGEASEPTTHVARELGIHFFAAGHHATERYGIKALGERLAQELSLDHQFIDVDNPV